MTDQEILLVGVMVLLYLKIKQDEQNPDQQEDLQDTALTNLDIIRGAVQGANPVDTYSTSDDMLDQLKRRESLRLDRYELGDGGYTWGYGHYSKNPNELPLHISVEDAESIFTNDVVNRAEKWVKLYVTVPLSQNQFDALVSIAFNLSPQSFKKFANEVNNGNGIDEIAAMSINWVPDQFKRGIAARRADELRVFNDGVYA